MAGVVEEIEATKGQVRSAAIRNMASEAISLRPRGDLSEQESDDRGFPRRRLLIKKTAIFQAVGLSIHSIIESVAESVILWSRDRRRKLNS